MTEIEEGDFVDAGRYGRGYVCNPNAGGRMVKLTELKSNSGNRLAPGWFVNEEDVEQITKSLNYESL